MHVLPRVAQACGTKRSWRPTRRLELLLDLLQRLARQLLDHVPAERLAQGLELGLLVGVEQRLQLLVERDADRAELLHLLGGAERGLLLQRRELLQLVL